MLGCFDVDQPAARPTEIAAASGLPRRPPLILELTDWGERASARLPRVAPGREFVEQAGSAHSSGRR